MSRLSGEATMEGSSKRYETFWRGAVARAVILWLGAVSVALGAYVPARTVSALVGVVTYSEPSASVLYIQTASAGFRISLPDGAAAPAVGDLVRVDGQELETNGPPVISAGS